MHLIHHRRASLGLAIHGPFNRNRRRSLRNTAPALIVASLILALAAFLAALFL